MIIYEKNNGSQTKQQQKQKVVSVVYVVETSNRMFLFIFRWCYSIPLNGSSVRHPPDSCITSSVSLVTASTLTYMSVYIPLTLLVFNLFFSFSLQWILTRPTPLFLPYTKNRIPSNTKYKTSDTEEIMSLYQIFHSLLHTKLKCLSQSLSN